MISFTKSNPPTASDVKTLDIIVADDVAEIRQLIGQWLGEPGHRIAQAATGREVIRLAHDRPCDLIVTDILMPDGDGLDVIIALRHSHPGIRILGVSGGGRHMSANDALRLAQAIGADGMLLKPFTRNQLFEALDRAMNATRK